MIKKSKTESVWLLIILNTLQRINDQRHLYSIRTAFVSLIPIMLIGAYATIINHLPIPAYQRFMDGLFGARWHDFGALVFNATIQIVALLVAFQVCANLARWYNEKSGKQVHGGICGMVGLVAYITTSIPVTGESSLPLSMNSVTGLFVAMVTSVVAGEIFIHLYSRKKMMAILSEDPNTVIPQSFASVVPAAVVVFFFVSLRMTFIFAGVDAGLSEIVNDIFRAPFQDVTSGAGIGFSYSLFSHVMWLFGIHGTNVLDGVAQNVLVPALEANAAAAAAGVAPPNLITKTMLDVFVYMGGSGTTLALLISLILFGYGRSHRALTRAAFPNAIFNINEPLIFGIPIVLNPIYAIPFVMAPMVTLAVSALAMQLGLVPYTVAEVNWVTPIFVSGYLATGGSIAGILLQIVNLFLATLIYAPFVKLSKKVATMRFERAYEDLTNIVVSDYSISDRRIINRMDEIGAVARTLANQIPCALKSGEMFLHYQPIINVHNRDMHSVEALLRWKHPIYDFINPMVIIALAEETEYIDELGLWIINEAMAQRAEWTQQGLHDFYVSVNVSSQQLNAQNFHTSVVEILKQHDTPANQLQIEITETMALAENTITLNNLHKLHEAGVTIAMDDFGVGHSSLLYLRNQPIKALKIDGSLSRGVVEHPANIGIIATIHDLCRLLEIYTIIEYVDNEMQLEKLMGVGVFLVQGYLFSQPLSGSELPVFAQRTKGAE